jgi:hypothetical protein
MTSTGNRIRDLPSCSASTYCATATAYRHVCPWDKWNLKSRTFRLVVRCLNHLCHHLFDSEVTFNLKLYNDQRNAQVFK